MKNNLWKLMLLIAVGALSCRIKIFGCFPFVVIWFVAVYMEEYGRRAFVAFMMLFMFLWLPIVGLCRYGITLLVWMVVMAIFGRMGLGVKRITQSVFAGLISVGIYYGGCVLSNLEQQEMILIGLEGMLIAGASFVVNHLVAMFLQWDVSKSNKENEQLPAQVQNYSMAMAGLAKSIQSMMQPIGMPDSENRATMEQELRHRICVPCERYQLCFGQCGAMAPVIGELVRVVEEGEEIDEGLQDKLYTQCQRAEVLIREAVSVFEKLELNMAWYRRLCEHREMIAGQIDAMAYVMGECLEEEKLCDNKERWRLMQIKYRLKDAGFRVSQLHIYRRKNGACRISVELSTRLKTCVTQKEALGEINACYSTEMVAGEKNRNIIGRERTTYEFVSKPKIVCDYGVAKMVQEGQEVSGDSFRAGQCAPGKYIMCLSDGMGSGQEARMESETVVDLLFQFAEAGFAMDVALRLMNAAMIFGADRERFSTLDVCQVDEDTGIVDFYKVGAHVSYIRHKSRVEVIDAESLPMGAAGMGEPEPNRCYLEPGDCLVMVTDGVLECLHVEKPVEALQDMIREMETCEPAVFSRKLLERIMLFTGGRVLYDMTVLTLKTEER